MLTTRHVYNIETEQQPIKELHVDQWNQPLSLVHLKWSFQDGSKIMQKPNLMKTQGKQMKINARELQHDAIESGKCNACNININQKRHVTIYRMKTWQSNDIWMMSHTSIYLILNAMQLTNNLVYIFTITSHYWIRNQTCILQYINSTNRKNRQ